MCTVTFVPFRDGRDPALRIACNRDESRQRGAGLPPRLRRFGDCRALLPVDPASGGTWIAVNDAGLVMVLLNQNSGSMPRRVGAPRLSRGLIIPSLLHCDNLHGAEKLACKLAHQPFAPFRLILASRTEVLEVSTATSQLQIVQRPISDWPLLFTSSGLGDALVEGPRRNLFRAWFQDVEGWVKKQDSFHRHSWPERPHLSVCMRRKDACTVSYTVIELRPLSAVMTYVPYAPDEIGPSVTLTMNLKAVETA